MEIPIYIRATVESLASGRKISELKKISDEITRRYKAEDKSGKRLISLDDEALVYSIVRMPATFCAVSAALRFSLERLPAPQIHSLLDVGAGTGAASLAALALFPEIKEVDCVERERAMMELGKRFYEESGFGGTVNWQQADISSFQTTKKYDLVIASYALNEFSESGRIAVLQKLWQMTEKLLLIVEPGTPSAFSMQRELRRELISMNANLVAPCPHAEDCPLPPEDWCHFVCRVPRSKLHRLVKGGDSPFEDEKFTYTAVIRFDGDYRTSGRVLRHPLIGSGNITMKLCTREGIFDKTFTKRSENFKRVKKLQHGDSLD